LLRITRVAALIFAYLFLALALVGIFVPGLPTVPFLLLTAWFAAKGSERLHRWLYAHPRLGQLLIDWEKQGAISRRSKIVALVMISLSWLVMFYRIKNVWLVFCISIVLIIVLAYLFSRPEPR